MDRVATLTKQMQDWYDHSPTAQRAYARLIEDVASVKTWATPKAHDLWERVAPLVEPSSKPGASNDDGTPASDGANRS
jgi:hypothetical protein